jgi:hypothetical protein
MDDELYALFSPTLTTSTTPGININTMKEPVLRALIPRITKEEVTDFFKFRDATDLDNKFKVPEDFFKYVARGIAGFQNNPQAITDLKDSLKKANINLIVEETQFKITVEARVNNSYRTIEAWVDLSSSKKPDPGTPGASPSPNQRPGANGVDPVSNPGGRIIPDPGLKITFMRII